MGMFLKIKVYNIAKPPCSFLGYFCTKTLRLIRVNWLNGFFGMLCVVFKHLTFRFSREIQLVKQTIQH